MLVRFVIGAWSAVSHGSHGHRFKKLRENSLKMTLFKRHFKALCLDSVFPDDYAVPTPLERVIQRTANVVRVCGTPEKFVTLAAMKKAVTPNDLESIEYQGSTVYGLTAKADLFFHILGTRPIDLWRNLSLLKAKGVVWVDAAHKRFADSFVSYLVNATDPVVDNCVRAIVPSVVKSF